MPQLQPWAKVPILYTKGRVEAQYQRVPVREVCKKDNMSDNGQVQYNWFRLAHDRTGGRQLIASVRT